MSVAPRIAELSIAAEHAAYSGHFPGFPILPGAVLLDLAVHEIVRSRNLELECWRVTTVKFLKLVRPGEPLTLEHSASDATTIRFGIRNAGGAVAAGTLSGRSDASGASE